MSAVETTSAKTGTAIFSARGFGDLGMNRTLFGNMTINGKSSKAPSSSFSSSTRNSAIAGYVAGVSGTVIGYPLDSAKVWIQTNTVGKNKHMLGYQQQQAQQQQQQQAASGSVRSSSHSATGNATSSASTRMRQSVTTSSMSASMSTLATSNSTWTAKAAPSFCNAPANHAPASGVHHLRTAVQTVRALYSGVSGPLVTVGAVQSVNFATYDATRRLLYRWDVQQSHHPGGCGGGGCGRGDDYLTNDSLIHVGVAGALAGTTTALVTAPLILVKTHQQITGRSFRQAVRETLLSPDGRRLRLGGCAAGFVPHALSETVGRGVYYATYEALKRGWGRWKEANGQSGAATTTLQERMACAATSGVLCWVTIFPLDTLRSRLYSTGASGNNPAGGPTMMEMIRIMRRERSFYRGFWLTVVRAGPVAAAVLPVYDLTLETLSARDVSA